MARELPTTFDIYQFLFQSMDDLTAKWLSEEMHDFVVDDVKSAADEEYNDDDVRLAIGRYLRFKMCKEE